MLWRTCLPLILLASPIAAILSLRTLEAVTLFGLNKTIYPMLMPLVVREAAPLLAALMTAVALATSEDSKQKLLNSLLNCIALCSVGIIAGALGIFINLAIIQQLPANLVASGIITGTIPLDIAFAFLKASIFALILALNRWPSKPAHWFAISSIWIALADWGLFYVLSFRLPFSVLAQ